MIKQILKLDGARELNKDMQKVMNGGLSSVCPRENEPCFPGTPVNCITAQPLYCVDGFWTSGPFIYQI